MTSKSIKEIEFHKRAELRRKLKLLNSNLVHLSGEPLEQFENHLDSLTEIVKRQLFGQED